MNPCLDLPPVAVPLARAPLDFVLCQVRFPAMFSVGTDEKVAPFQDALRMEYPLVESQMVHQFQLMGPAGAMQPAQQLLTKTYRFSTADGSWTLSLTPEFLSLQAKAGAYQSRQAFMTRLGQAMQALETHIVPTHCTRLGVRYLDRIKGGDLGRVGDFFRPELAGLRGNPDFGGDVQQLLSQALLKVKEGNLAVRWGLLPANNTIDPISIQPDPADSWILDLDAYKEGVEPFNAARLVGEAEKLSERIYTFFRWSVLPPFLHHYEG